MCVHIEQHMRLEQKKTPKQNTETDILGVRVGEGVAQEHFVMKCIRRVQPHKPCKPFPSSRPSSIISHGRPLIKCKMSNGCEVCQVCHYLSQSNFMSLQFGKVVNGKFGTFPLVCDDATR